MTAWRDTGPEVYIGPYAVKAQERPTLNGIFETRLLVRDMLRGSYSVAVQLPQAGSYEPS